MPEIDWSRVAQNLKATADLLRQNADAAFHGDQKTKDEMYGRARLAEMLAQALWAGMERP